MVTFGDNHSSKFGGAFNLFDNVNVTFTESAIVNFNNNSANFNDASEKYGGAVNCVNHCDLLFEM